MPRQRAFKVALGSLEFVVLVDIEVFYVLQFSFLLAKSSA